VSNPLWRRPGVVGIAIVLWAILLLAIINVGQLASLR
jgi:hypothetical protein